MATRSMACTVRNKRWIGLLLALAWVVACTEGPRSGEAPGEPASAAAQAGSDELLLAASKVALPPPGVAPLELPDARSQGAQLVVKYCTACHALPTPLIHSATDWPGVVRRMWLRTDRVPPRFNVPVPEAAERLAMARYLIDNALKVSGAALPAGPGRELFSSTCSQCHDLPDPLQHSPGDWVAVVQRMSERIAEMLGKTLAQQDFTRIVLYLETVSRSR